MPKKRKLNCSMKDKCKENKGDNKKLDYCLTTIKRKKFIGCKWHFKRNRSDKHIYRRTERRY
jgi:hypothetical protein